MSDRGAGGVGRIFRAELVIAILALLLTVGSMWLTQKRHAQQLQLSRDHNELSVKPILSLVSAFDSENDTHGIVVTNAGLGPARIKNVVYGITDVWFEERGKEGIDRMLKSINLPPNTALQIGVFSDPLNDYINPGESRKLFSYDGEKVGQSGFSSEQSFARANVAICYCSVYGKCWSVARRNPVPPESLVACER